MDKELERFKKLWYARNPAHEINADSGEDMFWKTAMMVAQEFNSSPSLREQPLREAAEQLLHLHMCEQEGLSSGQPTREQWLKAVDNLSAALAGEAEGHFLTNEELEKKISDAWDAAEKRVKHENTKYQDAFNFTINEKITPNKAEYLKSIK